MEQTLLDYMILLHLIEIEICMGGSICWDSCSIILIMTGSFLTVVFAYSFTTSQENMIGSMTISTLTLRLFHLQICSVQQNSKIEVDSGETEVENALKRLKIQETSLSCLKISHNSIELIY